MNEDQVQKNVLSNMEANSNQQYVFFLAPNTIFISFLQSKDWNVMVLRLFTIQELDCIDGLSFFCKMFSHFFSWLWAFKTG